MATEKEFLNAYNTLDNELHIILGRQFRHPLIKALVMIMNDASQAAQLETIRKYRNTVIGHGTNIVEVTVPDNYVKFLESCTRAIKSKPREEIRKKLEKAIAELDKQYKDKKKNSGDTWDKYGPANVNLTTKDDKLAFEQTTNHGISYLYSIYYLRNYYHVLIVNSDTKGKVYIYLDDDTIYCKSNATKNYKIKALISGSGFTDRHLGGHFFEMDDHKILLKCDKDKALHYSSKDKNIISIKIWFNYEDKSQVQVVELRDIDLRKYGSRY